MLSISISPLHRGDEQRVEARVEDTPELVRSHGRAVQVEPNKPMLKAPGTKRLKPQHEKLLSNGTFNCYLRRYTTVAVSMPSGTSASSSESRPPRAAAAAGAGATSPARGVQPQHIQVLHGRHVLVGRCRST